MFFGLIDFPFGSKTAPFIRIYTHSITVFHASPITDTTNDSLTATHITCHCGHLEITKYLLQRSADPNAKALNGWNPLHVCCKKNRLEIARLLMNYGANVSARTTSGLTPLHLAAYSGAYDIVKVFVETIFGAQEITNKELLQSRNDRGETVLHMAVRSNNADCVKFLLENGEIDVDGEREESDLLNNGGLCYPVASPLQVACRLGNLEAVKLLLAYNADINRQLNDGSLFTSPLQIAIRAGHTQVVARLLDSPHINIEIIEQAGSVNGRKSKSTIKISEVPVYSSFTPLLLASSLGLSEIVELLIDNGAKVKPINSCISALHAGDLKSD